MKKKTESEKNSSLWIKTKWELIKIIIFSIWVLYIRLSYFRFIFLLPFRLNFFFSLCVQCLFLGPHKTTLTLTSILTLIWKRKLWSFIEFYSLIDVFTRKDNVEWKDFTFFSMAIVIVVSYSTICTHNLWLIEMQTNFNYKKKKLPA